ncbi:hypothetical protein GCM10028812_53800 [Ancylobacter sonchi]
MKSNSYRRSGAGAWNWRLTWSSGQSEAWSLIVVRTGGPYHSLQAKLALPRRRRVAGDLEAFPAHMPPELAHTIDGEVLGEDPGDLGL